MSDLTDDSIWNVSQSLGFMPNDTIDYEMMYYENGGSNVSNDTNYRLWTTDQNSFYYLPSAMLQVDFKTTKADGSTQVALADNTALIGNGWGLFQDARLRIGDQELAHITHPAKASHLRNMVEAGREYIQTVGENAHYFCDEHADNLTSAAYVAADPATATASAGPYNELNVAFSANDVVESVTFNPLHDPAYKRRVDRAISSDYSGIQKIFLPLKDLFPLLELDHVVRGSKIEVELNKISNVAEALYGTSSDALITISRVRMWIARVRPSFDALAKVEKQIVAKPVVEHKYDNVKLYTLNKTTAAGEHNWQLIHKSARPTRVYIGFQFQSRNTSRQVNSLEFDLLGTAGTSVINRVELRLDGKQIPNIVYDPSYDHARIVQELQRLGGSDIDASTSSCLTVKNWRDYCPIFGFDLSQKEGAAYESRSNAVLDLIWNLSGAADANYNVVALVMSEGQAYFDHSSGVTSVKTQ
jgi:hypothetical protein